MLDPFLAWSSEPSSSALRRVCTFDSLERATWLDMPWHDWFAGGWLVVRLSFIWNRTSLAGVEGGSNKSLSVKRNSLRDARAAQAHSGVGIGPQDPMISGGHPREARGGSLVIRAPRSHAASRPTGPGAASQLRWRPCDLHRGDQRQPPGSPLSPQETARFRAGVTLLPITAVVRDSGGRLVRDLGLEDLEVLENG